MTRELLGEVVRNMFLVDDIQGHGFEWKNREDELKLHQKRKKGEI